MTRPTEFSEELPAPVAIVALVEDLVGELWPRKVDERDTLSTWMATRLGLQVPARSADGSAAHFRAWPEGLAEDVERQRRGH